MTVTAAEVAGLRRRYLWMATSVAFLSLTINVIFAATTDAWSNLWRPAASTILLLGGANWLIARRLFEPIKRFLVGEIAFYDIQRRLTQLPLLSAR